MAIIVRNRWGMCGQGIYSSNGIQFMAHGIPSLLLSFVTDWGTIERIDFFGKKRVGA